MKIELTKDENAIIQAAMMGIARVVPELDNGQRAVIEAALITVFHGGLIFGRAYELPLIEKKG